MESGGWLKHSTTNSAHAAGLDHLPSACRWQMATMLASGGSHQALQVVVPALGLKVPMGQGVQWELPALE